MKATIELLKKQHDVLVDVIVWMDQNKKSNTEIRSKVDTILNSEHWKEKRSKEDNERLNWYATTGGHSED